MRRRAWTLAVWIVTLFILQAVLAPAVLPSGVRPDWILVFVTLLGFLAGSPRGLVTGVLTGLLLDVVTGRFIGLHAFLKGAGGWFGGLLSRHVYRENVAVALLAVAVAALLQELVALAVLRAFGVNLSVAHVLAHLPPTISVDLVVAGVLYPIMMLGRGRDFEEPRVGGDLR